MERKSEENKIAMGIAMLAGSIGMICFCVACIFALVKCVPEAGGMNEPEQVRDTIYEVVFDTIPYYYPVPKDSVDVRYVTERLPIVGGSTPSPQGGTPPEQGSRGELDSNVCDSVDVVLPITQKCYEDSTFSAWVSGYKPSLDSIYVFPRKEVQTITIHTKEQKRWSIGVSGGIGVVYDGGWHCGPGVNVGVSYSF